MAYFNDPNLAKAFAGLGSLFGPPKASDVYAYAKAQEVRDAVQRAREGFGIMRQNLPQTDFAIAQALGAPGLNALPGYNLLQQSRQPGATPQSLVNAQIGAGAAYQNTAAGVGDKLANDIRLRQMAEAAATGRNNADNIIKERIAAAAQAGQTDRAMLAPVQAGGTRFIPPALQQRYGVDPAQRGNVVLNPGQRATLPTDTGAVVPPAGPDAPVADDATQSVVLQGSPKPPSGANVYMAKLPDGTTGPAVMGPDGALINPQTGAPLPPNVQITKTQGDLGSLTTATKSKFQSARNTARDTLQTIQQYESLITKNPGSVGLAALVKGTAQDVLATGDAFSKAFGGLGQSVMADLDKNVRNKAQLAGYFDTSIPAAKFLQHVLAYKLAQTENPQGEVSRQAFERALDAIGTGVLATPQSVMAKLGAFRQTLQSKMDAMDASERGDAMPRAASPAAAPAGPQEGATATNPQTGQKVILRNGKWEPMQ